MQAVKRASATTHHVVFAVDDGFIERMRQLRSLVPPLSSINRQRDLVIDKVRVRLPSAVWRAGSDVMGDIEGSCLVVATDGVFSCGAKDQRQRDKLVTHTFPISRLIELHAVRPAGETFFIREGKFANEEAADSDARAWMASVMAAFPTAASTG